VYSQICKIREFSVLVNLLLIIRFLDLRHKRTSYCMISLKLSRKHDRTEPLIVDLRSVRRQKSANLIIARKLFSCS